MENANRDLANRFDFRGVEASIEQNGLDVTLKTQSDFQVQQLEELFAKAAVKQGISVAGAYASPLGAAELAEAPGEVKETAP